MSTTPGQRLEAIKRGRDYLCDHEWYQQGYFEYSDDDVADYNVCDVIGALAMANGWVSEDEESLIDGGELLDAAIDELNSDLPHLYDDIVALNDAATAKKHVIEQMDKTIARLASIKYVAFSGVR
jgi:hypothetical protein